MKFDFLYGRLAIPRFFVSQWLHVQSFVDALEDMKARNVEINAKSVLPVMASIVKNSNGSEAIDGISVNTLAKGIRLISQSVKDTTMDDDWFIKKFGEIYEEVIALRDNDDYVVNPGQMDKFLDLISFFMGKAAKYDDDYVEIEKLEKKQEFGGVTATFVVFSLSGVDEVSEFCKVLKCCSAVSVDVVDEYKVCISCTVPDIFILKS